jgi:hypothetical protein
MKLTGHQATWRFSATSDKRRTCFICGKHRSDSARHTQEIATLDQLICSRRPCAKLKTSLAEACRSGTLTIDIHHNHHSSVAKLETQSHAPPSELHGTSSTARRIELPGDFAYQIPRQGCSRLATIPGEPPYLDRSTKPSKKMVAAHLSNIHR